jgi:hypothetical protein
MKRVVLLVSLLLGLFAVSATGSIITALPAKAESMNMEACEAQCKKCQKVCEATLVYCQKKGGKHAEAKHINTLKDCILSCKTSADYLSRNSANHMKSCGFCAAICKVCAESCEAFTDDKKMKDCAAECRKCAESCEKMSNMK